MCYIYKFLIQFSMSLQKLSNDTCWIGNEIIQYSIWFQLHQMNFSIQCNDTSSKSHEYFQTIIYIQVINHQISLTNGLMINQPKRCGSTGICV